MLIDDYFKIYTECINEYGEKTVVLMQVGSFYEIYKVDNEKERIGNADIIADILNIAYSKKNKTEKSTRNHPNFAGFTKTYLSKYVTPLLENDYTIVIVDELEKSSDTNGKLIKRGITAVYSQCLKSPEFQITGDTESHLTSILIERVIDDITKKNCFFYSVCSVNNTTNEIGIIENVITLDNKFNLEKDFKIVLDELARVLLKYNSKEILCYYKSENRENVLNDKVLKDEIQTFLYESCFKYKYIEIGNEEPEYNKLSYQNDFFRKVYNHINFGMETPIEYMCIENSPLSRLNLIYTLEYMSRYDKKYISNLTIPKIIDESCNLVLELNTSEQLHLVPKKFKTNFSKFSSVFDVINFTKTAIGRRSLKKLLLNPFTDKKEIEKRYNLSCIFSNLDETLFKNIETTLGYIIDFERLHRKMGLNMLHPYEFEKLHNTYTNIFMLINDLNEIVDLEKMGIRNKDKISFAEYIHSYTKTFNLEEMKRITLSTNKDEIVNYFNKSVVKELDKIGEDIDIIQKDMEEIREKLEKSINLSKQSEGTIIKLQFSDNDGYYFCTTKIRYSKLINENKDIQFTMRSTSNMCKFTTNELTKLSTRLVVTRDLLVKKVKMHYLLKLEEYYKRYNDVFKNILFFTSLLDITISNVKCSRKYLYCKPEIIENNENVENNEKDSFVDATCLRHPIIERICETEYIPNDIILDKDCNGMLLYGLNSSGKSSLLRALGICIVLAQCGLYVPCKKMKYYPFKSLISQVDLTDNLFSGKSSFITEMSGLKKILSCVGKNTLVLSDELCRGTEVNSSCAIVASCLSSLQKSNTKFFFTTHLHQIAQLPIIQKMKTLKICHLSISTQDDNIIFNRTIKDGSGSDLYGLEVCKSIIHDDFFIETAFNIRNEIIENKSKVLSTKKSRYNNKKIINECEICGYKPKRGGLPLDTHHINEQKNCDEMGFVKEKFFHKNQSFNLVSLCKPCHLKIDTGELVINGYLSSTSGKILDYKIF